MSIWVRSSTNIALIKYWGKEDFDYNWPVNDSVSMGLKDLCSLTSSRIVDGDCESGYIVYFNDVLLEKTDLKFLRIKNFLDRVKSEFGFSGNLEIKTKNSFYSDCGIASSASGFSALTVSCILTWTGSKSLDELEKIGFDIQKLASISRWGSGSSCRSFLPGIVWWKRGDSPFEQQVVQIDDLGWELSDTIVIISSTAKKIPSSEGHKLASRSPHFRKRVQSVDKMIQDLLVAVKQHDIESLGRIIEIDCESMHRIMDSSGAGYRSQECLEFLDKFKKIRDQIGIGAYYTQDAGSSVHIISEKKEQPKVVEVLKKNFSYELICDEISRSSLSVFE